jgi:hypothetical protein
MAGMMDKAHNTERTSVARTWASRGLAVALACAAVGCQTSYNGAWSLKSEDKAAVAAYEEMRQQREKQQAEHRQRTTPTQFAAPGSRASVDTSLAVAASPQASAAQAQAVPAAGRSTEPLRPLTLFGDLPHTSGVRTSALDGPDNLRRATFSPEGADFDPDVDPSGQWLVYASTRHREQSDIYLQRVDGTTVTQITNDPANDTMPCFSPDGKQVAFASDRAGNWDVYLVDVNGGQPIQLTSDPAHEIHPSFSPDGTKLVYCTFGGQSGQWEMVVIDVSNPAARRFIGYGLFPTWSPAGDRILFQRASDRGQRRFSIWTVDLVNGEAVRPTEIAASSNAAVITPSWSPDGQHIVFSTVVEPESSDQLRPIQADIWVVSAVGNGRANLTQSPFTNLQPVWSPDGTIYFVSNRGETGTENIWSVRPDRALKLAAGAGQVQPTRMSSRQVKPEATAAAPMPGKTAEPAAAATTPRNTVAQPTARKAEVPVMLAPRPTGGADRAGTPGEDASAMVKPNE